MANETMTGQPSSASPQSTSPQSTPPAETTPAPSTPAQSSTPGAQGATAAQPGGAAAPQVDSEAAHKSLVAARDALNQLTQLPAASQLSGEARTQVQQLITNFNELITNTTDWRASYTKVAATLTTLLGPDTADAQAAAATPTANATPTATPGAAGTTGTAAATGAAAGTAGAASVQLDPAIRAKLVEMRASLNEFQKASGGIGK